MRPTRLCKRCQKRRHLTFCLYGGKWTCAECCEVLRQNHEYNLKDQALQREIRERLWREGKLG